MKTMSADDLRRHALATGSEVVINGVPFNTAREVVVARRAPAPQPVALVPPAPRPEQPLSLLVDVAKLIADAERRLEAKFAPPASVPTAVAELELIPITVVPRYSADNTLPFIDVVQRRQRAPGEAVCGFTPKYRGDGAIESVTIEYKRPQ